MFLEGNQSGNYTILLSNANSGCWSSLALQTDYLKSSQLNSNGNCRICRILFICNFSHPVSLDGSVMYSKVKAFMKEVRSMVSMYKSITTSTNETNRISGNHLIYTRKHDALMFNPQYVLFSSNIMVQESYELIIPKFPCFQQYEKQRSCHKEVPSGMQMSY